MLFSGILHRFCTTDYWVVVLSKSDLNSHERKTYENELKGCEICLVLLRQKGKQKFLILNLWISDFRTAVNFGVGIIPD